MILTKNNRINHFSSKFQIFLNIKTQHLITKGLDYESFNLLYLHMDLLEE